MSEAGIGRVIVASLHQAIADILPSRLDFYENWLSPEGLRAGTVGQAQLAAVLSFLRREDEAYGLIMAQAGSYAADWTVDGLPARRRRSIRLMPVWLRARRVLRLARRLVRDGSVKSRATIRRGRGGIRLVVVRSVFCDVRAPAPLPLCGFYAAAAGRLLERFELTAGVTVASCRGAGGAECTIAVIIGVPAEHPSILAG